MQGGQEVATKLFPYEYVPPGFEIVIDLGSGAEHGHKGEIVPGSKGGIWNLWFNINLSDHPQTWDDEVKAINKMQARLSDLTDAQRLIRAQMAEFCRFHPLFPRSIDILCEEIGTTRFSTPLRLGCEGRGLLEALGYEDSPTLNGQRRESLEGYCQTLTRWLAQSVPENATDIRVYGFLGQRTDNKISFVAKLVSTIDPEESSMVAIKELCREQCITTDGESVFDFDARPFNCFNCEASAGETPKCLCSHAMLLNAALICTGVSGEERQAGKEFRLYKLYAFVQENILAYGAAINAWLSGASPQNVKWPQDGQYVTSEGSLQIAQRVHSSLGKTDEVEEWLAACLLKTVKSNQRWHKTTELIDNYPQATSWLTALSNGATEKR
jgi:hypothetical protein